VLKNLKYGLCAEDESVLSTIQLIPDMSGEISLITTLDEIIGKCNVHFNKALAFRKEAVYKYKFEDIFSYNGYTFVLKAIVCNEENEHFYAFIRNKFSTEYYLANDLQIKLASKEQIDNSKTVLGLYFIFENESNSVINDDSESVSVRVKEFQVSDEIKSLIEEIDGVYKFESTLRKIREDDDRELVNINSSYDAIRPHIRIISYNPMIMMIEEEIPTIKREKELFTKK